MPSTKDPIQQQLKHTPFRIHQFEKVEQFYVTTPYDNASWAALDEMLTNAEDFYQGLGLAYQVCWKPYIL